MARRSFARALGIPLVTTMTIGGLSAVAGPAAAEAAPTPVPTFTAVPTTPASRPYGSTDPGVADLAASGYVQEEYFISGTASGQPYTTRMLVRLPAQAARFSGIVIAESIRSTAVRSLWSLREYVVRSGHAYVEIGSNHLAVNKPPSRQRSWRLSTPRQATTSLK
jgi:hypothetical protein